MPAALAIIKVRKYPCPSAANKLFSREIFKFGSQTYDHHWNRLPNLRGTRINKTAFSWTCHPKRKEAYPQRVKAFKKDLYVGENHSFVRMIYGKFLKGVRDSREVEAGTITHELDGESYSERMHWLNIWEDGENRIADKSTGTRSHPGSIDSQPHPKTRCT